MALHKCRECGEPVSSDSAACPYCGKRRGWGLTDKLLGAFFVGLFLLFLAGIAERFFIT